MESDVGISPTSSATNAKRLSAQFRPPISSAPLMKWNPRLKSRPRCAPTAGGSICSPDSRTSGHSPARNADGVLTQKSVDHFPLKAYGSLHHHARQRLFGCAGAGQGASFCGQLQDGITFYESRAPFAPGVQFSGTPEPPSPADRQGRMPAGRGPPAMLPRVALQTDITGEVIKLSPNKALFSTARHAPVNQWAKC
jgi:hypothetical protein